MSLYQNFRSLFCLLVKTGLERLEIILRNVLILDPTCTRVQEFKIVGGGGGCGAVSSKKKNVCDKALYSSLKKRFAFSPYRTF